MSDNSAEDCEDTECLPLWIQQASLDRPSFTTTKGSTSNKTITPNKLCQLCMRAVAEYTESYFWEEDTELDNEPTGVALELDDDGFQEWYLQEEPYSQGSAMPHQPSPEALRQSSERGCHLCSLLMEEPDDFERKFREIESA